MGIVAEDIAAVRASTDIVAVIGEHTEIKRSGRQWMARCPLHGERTPSLAVSPDKGVFHCFGCGRSGDVITFVREIENLDFPGAVEQLAKRAGITLRYTRQAESAARARRQRLLEAVAAAAEFYHRRLISGDDAGRARGYLRSRGYGGDVIRRYRIGWAPDDWDQLARHLDLSERDLVDAGLGFVNRSGRQQDFFRARVLFPITNDRGDPVGFGGRVLPGDEGPKYKNTSGDAAVYDKSKVLYGLHEQREEIVRAGEAVICEGYTDVIGFATAGVGRAVATCGTALTADHVKLLSRFSARRLVLAFDADAAGVDAVKRVYEWEREFGIEVLVADLPAGVDPDDLAREDPDALKRAVIRKDPADLSRAAGGAVPLLQFRVDRALADADMATIEGRARAAAAAAEVVGEHPDELVRDKYLVDVADRCQVKIATLRGVWDKESGRRPSSGRTADRSDIGQIRLTSEDEALRLLIHRPDEVAGRLDETLFGDPIRGEAYRALSEGADLAVVGDRVGEPAARLLRRLAVEDASEIETDDVLALVHRWAGERAMERLRYRTRDVKDLDRQRAYNTALMWVKAQTDLLAERDTRRKAMDQLLPWLIDHRRQEDLYR